MPTKEKTDTQFNADLDNAIRKKRWFPMGGWMVAGLLVFLVSLMIAIPFAPQVTMQLDSNDNAPLRFGGNPPKTETYPSPEDDPRIVAWIGNSDLTAALSTFLINVGMSAHHDYFNTCTDIMSMMLSPSNYKAHLYIVSDKTYANMSFDDYGIIDNNIKSDVTGTGCAMFIKDAHPQAKVMCLGNNTDNLYDCKLEGFFVMHKDEAMSPDSLQDEFEDMTFFEGTVRDLIEIPLVPPD